MNSLLLFLGIVLGVLMPRAHSLSFLIQYLLMLMLFIAFLGIKLSYDVFNKSIIYILAANILLGLVWYFVISLFSHTFAVIAFITAIAPTATAAPAVMHFLKGKVEYVVASVILTNVVIAVLLPFMISGLHISNAKMSLTDPFLSIFIVIIVPLIAAQFVRLCFPKAGEWILKYKSVSFYAWLVVIFLAVSKSSYFIQSHREISVSYLVANGVLALVICIINFSLGRVIGNHEYSLEASQSLGQKNTVFTVWYSLSFLNPMIALGPVFYLVYHNIYNSYQMIHRAGS